MAKKKLTQKERQDIERQIAALQESLEEQEEAEGGKEQAEADEEVEEQRRKTAALFDRLGITEEDWEVLSTAIASGTEDRTRRIVREELAAEEEAEGSGGSLASAGEEKTPVETPPPDDVPAPSKHWTERKLFGKKQDEEEGPKDD